MSNTLKSNDNKKLTLPIMPTDPVNIDIYVRFMRHLRMVPNEQMEIKILCAIQFTADMLDMSDSLVAKYLVDWGLRAPRKSYPMAYLDYVDKALMRHGCSIGGPNQATLHLKQYWDLIDQDQSVTQRKDTTTIDSSIFVDV